MLGVGIGCTSWGSMVTVKLGEINKNVTIWAVNLNISSYPPGVDVVTPCSAITGSQHRSISNYTIKD